MKSRIIVFVSLLIIPFLFSFSDNTSEGYSLKVEIDQLRNSIGIAQFALYNKDGTIPDEHYEKYYKIGKSKIENGKATYTFTNLPKGKYAVNILHDENKNGKIDKGFIMPIEGIGFSNYQSIGLTNRPKFSKASFELNGNGKIKVKVIYM